MNSLSPLLNCWSVLSRLNRVRGLALCFVACALSSAVFAQVDPNAAPAGTDNQNARRQRGQNGGAGGQGGGRGNFGTPEEMQARMAELQREQFGVTDDAEWKLILDRITVVNELRRTTLVNAMGGLRGAFGGAGGPGAGGPGGGGRGRGGAGAGPEQAALQQAITDKLPDAEIKSRLERLREVRKANEEKLLKAQEDLRAVLTVRQEAVAVMSGLLP